MTKIVFWPADYFSSGFPVTDGLVLSEPVAGTVRVTWQANRGPDQVELYVRTHATNWPTLDFSESGVPDPTYLVGTFFSPALSFRGSPPTISPDQTCSTWTETGHTLGQIVRAIAVPRGRFGWTGTRATGSLTMTNAIGPALFFTGAGYLDDGLEDGLGSPGLDGEQITAFQQITRSSAVSNSGHDVHVEVLDSNGNWVNATKSYGLDGGTGFGQTTLDIDEAGTVNKINASMYPYLNNYPPEEPFTHLAMAIKLLPNGGGTPLDMLVAHYIWSTRFTP